MEAYHILEEQHRRIERRYWWWSVGLTLFATIIAAVGTRAAFSALDASRLQAKAAQDANRAWVNIDVDESQVSLNWDGRTARLNIEGSVINMGNSPALEAEAFFVPLITDFGSGSMTVHSAKVRDKVRSTCLGRLFGTRNLIFMKEVTRYGSSVEIPTSEMDADDRRWAEASKRPVEPGNMYSISIIACATYRIASDVDIHFTGRIFNVQKIGHPPGKIIALVVGDNIAKGQVVLQREFEGDYAD